MSSNEFTTLLEAFAQAIPNNVHSQDTIDNAGGTLFVFFDKDQNKVLDFGEIFIGMNLLFGGTAQDKIQVAFDFYDTSGDNKLQFDELLHYFTCTFNMILHNQINEEYKNKSVDSIAYSTTVKCFEECNQPIEGGAISIDEFKLWYK